MCPKPFLEPRRLDKSDVLQKKPSSSLAEDENLWNFQIALALVFSILAVMLAESASRTNAAIAETANPARSS